MHIWRTVGMIVVLAVPALAFGQANSDYFAYPKTYTPLDDYQTDRRELTFNRLPGLSPDYQIGPGDELDVWIGGLADQGQQLKVGNNGHIAIPYLGSMDVSEMTAGELEARIGLRLREMRLINEPQVLVNVSSYEAKPVHVLGEVDRPGQYMMSQQLTLMDLLFLSGGLDITASRVGYLHRRPLGSETAYRPVVMLTTPESAPPGVEVVRINLEPMKTGGLVQPNLVLRRGDVLYVPRRPLSMFYVIGDVIKAGPYELPETESMTISRAIARAGGPTRTAKLNKGILVRYNELGVREERPADFAAVLKGRQPDFEVKANDVIFVPGSASKTLGYGLLGSIPRIAEQSAVNVR